MKKIVFTLINYTNTKDKLLWCLGMIFMLVSSIVALYYPIIFNHILECIPKFDFDELKIILLLFLVHLLFISLSLYILGITGEKYVKKIRIHIIEKYLKKYIKDINYTELSSRVIYNSEIFSELISQQIPKLIISSIQLLIIIYIILSISLKLTSLIAMQVIIVFIISSILGKKMGLFHLYYQNLISKINQSLTEIFERRMLIHLNGTEKKEKMNIFSKLHHLYILSKRILLFNSIQYIIKQLMIIGVIGLTVYFINKEISSDNITNSNVRLYIMYCIQMLPAIMTIIEEITIIVDNHILLTDLYCQVESFSKNKADEVSQIVNNGTFIELNNLSNGKVNINHYLFSPSNVYQIIGISGIGKSTLIERILGFSNLYSGDVKISFESTKYMSDGISYYHNKQNIIVGKTIKENLKYFQNYEDKEILQVLSLFGIITDKRDDILNTIVSKENLSTGQLARIALAREFLKKEAEITILDEPYSHLDINSAKKIDYLFREKCKNSILIIISHKRELFRLDDKILELS
ncbi:hypothetical protein I568_02283 [Enterococcus columbae DSM 7374 = ATCC 51263]|uniref:ABC transporter domain-containing protein n=1 Tax=Enterococcus columbae DSM 7374 = ATCC 51263 TaxID=1121865 RepID=S1MT01_9ENTE|nr:ABC transporter ATP-binding protein [Enterococcus columbae]EOT39135.1 hypothetical protein OMW_02012 [Enterococcus columbae DSM 7374 = ATCC 51263]EOW79932.1 hypothetical protein I568_02283 [Enterococcus columbae DSM 7374 = ATCC 51263]